MKKSQMPIVSVIVPVYNVAEFLPKCLQCLADQTISEIEILCVDDGSCDDSPELIKAFREKDARFSLLQQRHWGVSAARNLGIDSAQGKYVIFIDGDDWTDTDMLRRMVECAEKTACDMVVCSADVHFEQTGIRGKRRRESLQAALTVPQEQLLQNDCSDFPWKIIGMPGGWPFIWNKLIRKDLLQQHQIRFAEQLKLGEDGVFLQMLLQYVDQVAFIKPALYHYRYQRKASATVSLYESKAIRFQQHICVVEVLIRGFFERDILKKNGERLVQWVLRFLYDDFVRLPAEEQKCASIKITALFEEYCLCEFGGSLNWIERNRLKDLLETTRKCSKSGSAWNIVRTKVENRVLRKFLRA